MNKVFFQTYPHFYDRMQEFIEENKQISKCDVCFLGDSIIEMFDVSTFNNLHCLNRGIVSDKTQGVLTTLDDRVVAINPSIIFMLIGTNDICDGYQIQTIIENIKNIIEYLKYKLPNTKIIVGTIIPPCYHEAKHVDKIYPECRDILRIKELNNRIKILQNVTILDTFSILADEFDSLKVEDTLDGVHLTKGAYNKIKNELIKLL